MKTILILFLITLPVFADKTFKIQISGENLDALKKKAEYEIVSSTQYCRGTLLPYPISKWECSGNGCFRNYTCKNITKKFSRFTEIPRLREEYKKAGEVQGSIDLPKPEKKLALDKPKPKLKKIEIKLPKKDPEEVIPQKMDKLDEEALALLDPEELKGDERIVRSPLSSMDKDITYEELAEPKKVKHSPFEKKEGDWKLKKTTSREGGFKTYELEKIVDKTERFPKKFYLLAGQIGLVGISGDNTDLSTINLAWTPRYVFSPLWAVRGELGIQFFNQNFVDQDNNILEKNNFVVSPFVAYLNYLKDFYFGEVGAGFQWWYNQEQEFNPMVSIGAGYRFPDTYFSLDRISLNYDFVWAQEDLSELKLSLTFLF